MHYFNVRTDLDRKKAYIERFNILKGTALHLGASNASEFFNAENTFQYCKCGLSTTSGCEEETISPFCARIFMMICESELRHQKYAEMIKTSIENMEYHYFSNRTTSQVNEELQDIYYVLHNLMIIQVANLGPLILF